MPVSRYISLKAGTYHLSSVWSARPSDALGARFRRQRRHAHLRSASRIRPIHRSSTGFWPMDRDRPPCSSRRRHHRLRPHVGRLRHRSEARLQRGRRSAHCLCGKQRPILRPTPSKCTPRSGGRALKLIPCRGWRARWIRKRCSPSRRSR